MKKKKKKKQIFKLFFYTVCISVTLVYLSPLVWMILTAFKQKAEVFSTPPKFLFNPTLYHFRLIIEEWGVLHCLYNSILISLVATTITVFVGTLAGYALVRFEFKNKELLALELLSVRVIPPIISGIALFLIGKALGLLNTHFYLILIYTVFNLPMVVWITASFISDIPIAIEESALIDGCTKYSVFQKIVLPLILPGLSAAFMITFIFCWNEFLFANIITSYETKTLPVLAAFSVRSRQTLWGAAAACGILLSMPPLIVCFLVGKYLVRGLTFGAVRE